MAALSTLALVGLTAASAIQQSNAQKAQGEIQQAQFNANSRAAKIAAEEEAKKGSKEAIQFKREADKIVGSQKAAIAGQGVSVSSGTASQLIEQTELFNELDAKVVENNAFRRSLGFETQSAQDALSGRLASSAARTRSRNTLITGGFGAATAFLGGGINAKSSSKK